MLGWPVNEDDFEQAIEQALNGNNSKDETESEFCNPEIIIQ